MTNLRKLIPLTDAGLVWVSYFAAIAIILASCVPAPALAACL